MSASSIGRGPAGVAVVAAGAGAWAIAGVAGAAAGGGVYCAAIGASASTVNRISKVNFRRIRVSLSIEPWLAVSRPVRAVCRCRLTRAEKPSL